MIIGTKMWRTFKCTMSLFSSANSLQKSCRYFQSSATYYIKMYLEQENKYAYSLMENKGYAVSLNLDKGNTSLSKEQFHQIIEDCSRKSPTLIFEQFSLLGDYCTEHNLCISNSMFDNFIDNLTDNVKAASDEELQSIFYSLGKLPDTDSVRTRNYIEVWAALDDVCLDRLKMWSFDKVLSFLSLFFMLNVTRASDFSKKALQKLASKAKQLTSHQLVQTMFFVGILRRQPYDMHNLEVQLDSLFEEFSVDDLAIASMGFFKSKTPIRSMELVTKISEKVIENSKTIHEISLSALLKVIRYSVKPGVDNKIYSLLDILKHEVPRLSIMCNIHVALLGTTTLILHRECLTKIADTIMTSLSQARLKDLERLVLTYGIYNFTPKKQDCFYQKVMDELRKPEREAEIQKYGRSFISCIEYLGLVGIYPVDLMSKALNMTFLEKTYGKQCILYGKAVLALHNTSQIFCGEVKMNRLNEKVAKILAKKYTDYVPDEDYSKQFNIGERMFLDILNLLKENRGGKDYVIGDHIVTHHQRGDVIICNNREGMPLPVGEAFTSQDFGQLRKPPDDNCWIALIIAGRNATIHNSDIVTGPFQAKMRELKALGFHVSFVLMNIYTNMKTKEEKLIYLNKLIKEAEKNK